jgi:stage II sporulation protein D
LLCWHLGVSGGLPKEVPTQQVRPWAAGQRQVRVLILAGAGPLSFRPQTSAAIENAAGSTLATVPAGVTVTARPWNGQVALRVGKRRLQAPRLVIRASSGGIALISGSGAAKRGLYPGALEIAAVGSSLRIIDRVPLEDYLAGVVAAEVPRSFAVEAMRAQAIAARTYTLSHLGDHAGQGADLCAQVHCQVYAGLPPAGSRASQAVRDTAGEVLVWNGLLVDALYHSACGGSTAAAWDVRQSKLLPYLTGGSDSDGYGSCYCGEDRDLHWTVSFTRQQAERLIAANLGTVLGRPGLAPGRLKSMRVAARRGTRAEWLEIVTSKGSYRVRGDSIRWLFGSGSPGPAGLKSIAFTLSTNTDRRGQPRAFVFQGAGHGHGIGLCQWGAKGRAENGQTAQEILAAYYPGAEIVDLRPG